MSLKFLFRSIWYLSTCCCKVSSSPRTRPYCNDTWRREKGSVTCQHKLAHWSHTSTRRLSSFSFASLYFSSKFLRALAISSMSWESISACTSLICFTSLLARMLSLRFATEAPLSLISFWILATISRIPLSCLLRCRNSESNCSTRSKVVLSSLARRSLMYLSKELHREMQWMKDGSLTALRSCGYDWICCC